MRLTLCLLRLQHRLVPCAVGLLTHRATSAPHRPGTACARRVRRPAALSGAVVLIAGLVLAGTVAAAERTTAPSATSPVGDKWANISQDVVDKLVKEGKKLGFGNNTAGVGVDRTTGDVYMIVSDQGLWKSADKGKTFALLAEAKAGGRAETGFALNFNPEGKGIAYFPVYSRGSITVDGRTWKSLGDPGSTDFGAVDWSDPQARTIFIKQHHTKGTAYLTADGGAKWTKLEGDGFAALGVFDAKTLVASRGEGIVRSTDDGKTWEPVSKLTPTGRVLGVLRGIGYWVSKEGVLVSRDKGKTWEVLGKPVEAYWGPYFGKGEKHIVVVGPKGFMETKDAGATWDLAAPLPDLGKQNPFYGKWNTNGWFLNYAWDPIGNVFYASVMQSATYRYER